MTANPAVHPLDHQSPAPRPVLRVWPALTLVALLWTVLLVSQRLEIQMFFRFLGQSAVLLLVLLAFLVWWLTRRRLPRAERWLVVGALLAAVVGVMLLSHKSMGIMPLFGGLPWLLAGWAVWLLLTRERGDDAGRSRTRQTGMLVIPFLAMGAFLLLRMEGLRGNGMPQYHWRWTPSAEEQLFAGGATPTAPGTATVPTTRTAALVLKPGDWPAFRGPDRDANVHGLRIATDWDNHPPKKLWSQRVGPAWSSIAVVDGRAFTQEQRGETELVVCRDAQSGAQLWAHEDPGRFEESLSGAGPRATPTFDGGRLYALGAKGLLNCLDAATGRRTWSKDITADAQASVPDWGFCSSPLVVNGKVIVYAGGKANKSLLAYDADTGNLAWVAAAGTWSYSSPHLATINGRQQVLFLSDTGVTAVDPAGGAVLWEHKMPKGGPRSTQPLPVQSNRILANYGLESATVLVELPAPTPAATAPVAAVERWSSRNLKLPFNDVVVHDGYVYGFDGSIFTCVDLKDGSRKWKKGRYGAGQVLLLPDQPVLLVTTEQGEAVLVACDPQEHRELGRFQAVSGKTWNHPAVAQGRLYVRSADEMACFELQPAP
jgi:outer membrane protein assembly factor BamB